MKTRNSRDFKSLVWISFTDFMLATTAIFLLLFLVSNKEISNLKQELSKYKNTDKDKEINNLKQELSKYKNTEKDKEISNLKQELSKYKNTESVKSDFMEELLKESNHLIEKKNNKYYIKSDGLLFKTGQFYLADNGKSGLKKISKDISGKINIYKNKLNKINSGLKIYLQVSGHTDNNKMTSMGDIKDNWDLSAKRSTEVVRFLSENGVPSKNLMSVGFGEFKPLEENNDDVNRRVELEIHIE